MTIMAELNLQAAGNIRIKVYNDLGAVAIIVGGEAYIALNLVQAKELGRQLYEEGLY